MGSSTHIQGTPQRPGLASSRGTASVLAHNQEQTADNREAIYVRPLGRGWHLVKNQCNDQSYRVSSLGQASYSPGSVVLLASNTGHPGERIIGGPAGDRRGASGYSATLAIRSTNYGVPPLTRAHVGLGTDGSNLIHAYKYLDGTYDSELGTAVDLTSITHTIQGFVILSISPLVFACWVAGTTPGTMYVVNFDTGTLIGPVTQTAGGGATNQRQLQSDKAGGAYWIRNEDSGGYFALYRLDSAGTNTKLTPGGSETVTPGTFDNPTQAHFPFSGLSFMPVYGSSGLRGHIEVSSSASAFVAGDAFLPFDTDTSEWLNWQGAGMIPGGDALLLVPTSVASVSCSGLGRMTASGTFTQLYTQTALGRAASSADASPDGTTAVLYASSGTDAVAHVALDGSTSVSWTTVDDMPIGGKPGQFWCLD